MSEKPTSNKDPTPEWELDFFVESRMRGRNSKGERGIRILNGGKYDGFYKGICDKKFAAGVADF